MTKREYKEKLAAIREAVANYMASEGCGCCANHNVHYIYKRDLAKLLDVPQYSDGSGYDFGKFETQFGERYNHSR